ncbi:MAG: hypothetical protein ACRDGM_08595 [bacterium]
MTAFTTQPTNQLVGPAKFMRMLPGKWHIVSSNLGNLVDAGMRRLHVKSSTPTGGNDFGLDNWIGNGGEIVSGSNRVMPVPSGPALPANGNLRGVGEGKNSNCQDVNGNISGHIGENVTFVGIRTERSFMHVAGEPQFIQFWLCTDSRGQPESRSREGGFAIAFGPAVWSDAAKKMNEKGDLFPPPFHVTGRVKQAVNMTIRGHTKDEVAFTRVLSVPFLTDVRIDVR